LLLGIALPAGLSFCDPKWPVADDEVSPTLFVACFVIHVFRMTLFFVIAGFFAHMSFHRRGLKNFVVDRFKRIGIPFIVAWPLLLVVVVAVLVWAGGSGKTVPEQPLDALTWRRMPLLHTWFLYMLLWLYAGTLLVVGLARLLDRGQRLGAWADCFIRAIVKTNLAPVVLGAPLFAVFFFHESWIPWLGVHTPDTGLLPNLAATVAFGTAFGFGWLMHRQIELLEVWKRWWPLHLVLAAGATMGALGFSGGGRFAGGDSTTSMQLAAAAIYPLAIWTWTFALIGLGVAFMSGHSPVRRYLADASYWLYLIHLPIILALQVLISQMPWPWFAKYPAILAISFLPMIASYHFLVRGTAIGAFLNGRRYGKGTLIGRRPLSGRLQAPFGTRIVSR
jgi:peptidoglycan/LPS O-acetylase OafA/YrhL